MANETLYVKDSNGMFVEFQCHVDPPTALPTGPLVPDIDAVLIDAVATVPTTTVPCRLVQNPY